MSDHVDGPRSIGDPSTDLTDLYAFISPENARRVVLIADVFPSAGDAALFSNAAVYAIVVRAVSVAGTGAKAGFAAGGAEVRFAFTFENLKPGVQDQQQIQAGVCTLPDGQTLALRVNDEAGVTTADGSVRLFAGLRSDPFYDGWMPNTNAGKLQSIPNAVQDDNVLSLVVEIDTEHWLGKLGGTMFGAIAESRPKQFGGFFGKPIRLDWVGRPEQTNFRLNLDAEPDLRDLWNQQTPYAIDPLDAPIFRERLTKSFKKWDMIDGKADWPEDLLAANVNVFFDDFLLFDLAKPITDLSHLEIERSTIHGKPYQTGGGRTLDANSIDILVTWLVNRDTGSFMQGGCTGPTQPGGKTFPYVRPPNHAKLSAAKQVRVAAAPASVWGLIGNFGGFWHPLVATIKTTGEGVGQLRTMGLVDGKVVIERLASIDQGRREYTYTMVCGLPVTDYTGMMRVEPDSSGSLVTWEVRYTPDGQPDFIVRVILDGLLGSGMKALEARYGALK